MTGVDRLNIHECQNVCRFIDDANRPFASDQFTENAGFQINCRHFGPIFILYHSHNFTNTPTVVAYSQMSAWDGADRFVVVIEPGAALASQDLSIESGEKPPKMLRYPGIS
jgi:hypothetical protein